MIAALITRLGAAGSAYTTIQHAWTLDAIDSINTPMPMALFIPGPIQSEASGSLPIRQMLTETIVVMTICPWAELDDLRNQLYGALLGYQHNTGYTELEHRQGEVNRINGSVVQWMDMFVCNRWMGPAVLPYPDP